MENHITCKCDEIIRLNAQEAIKIPLALELGSNASVIDSFVTVFTQSIDTSEKGVKVNARINFNVLYKDDEIDDYESSTEISFEFKHELLSVDSVVFAEYKISGVQTEKTDGSVAISALIGCEIAFYNTVEQEILSEIDGAVCKRRSVTSSERIAVNSSSFEINGEKVLPYAVKKVLFHKHTAYVSNAQSGIDEVISDGEILSEFLLLTERDEIRFESLSTSFRIETEQNGISPENTAVSSAFVQDANLQVVSDEENSNCTINALFLTQIVCEVYADKQVGCIQDAFFRANEIILEREDVNLQSEVFEQIVAHKFFGEAVIDCAESDKVKSLAFRSLEDLDFKKADENTEVSVLVNAKILTEADEKLKTCTAEMPLNFNIDVKGDVLQICACIKTLSVKQSDGKYFMEGELVLSVIARRTQSITAVKQAQTGEERATDESTIGIVFIQAGDDEWSVCKKACVDADTLWAQNPELILPAEEDGAVVVYRCEK